MVESLQIDKSLSLISRYISYITGMNTFVKKSERDQIQHRNHRIRYFIIFGLLIIEPMIGIKFISDGPGFTSKTYLMPCLTVSILSYVKSIFFITHDDLVNEFIQLLRYLEKEHDDDNDDVKRVFEDETVFLNRVLRVMDFWVKMLMIAFPLMPIFVMVIVYYYTGNWELHLPYLNKYPFDALNIKVLPFVYFRQTFSVVTVLFQISDADYIFCIDCSYLRIQFRLLSHEMDNEEFRGKFKKLVLLHHDVIRSQKPCRITAYRFTDVTLRTFMRIMSTSWSYFCLLRTTYR